MSSLRRIGTTSALGIARPKGLTLHRRDVLALLAFGVALPNAARAGSKPLKIVYIALTPHEDAGFEAIFMERLKQMGYHQGDTLDLSYRSADGRAELLHDIASAAVADKPDILVAGFGTLAAKAATAATKTIPVIFTCVGDPLGAGLIGDLAHPGGNVTGVSAQVGDLGGKRLQLLLELAPAVKSVGVLFNPETP
ncbi:MAG: ABC transporter substrate binding protein, partial [Janthinobacterium lividum]